METKTLEANQEDQLHDEAEAASSEVEAEGGGDKATPEVKTESEETKGKSEEGEKVAIEGKASEETAPKTQYVSLEQYQALMEQSRKMQGTFTAKLNAANKTTRLEAAARMSRQRLDPMAPNWQEETPEEKALVAWLNEVEKHEAAESQEDSRAQIFERVTKATAAEIQEMIEEAEVDLGDADTNPKLAEVAKLLYTGDFNGAKKIVRSVIREAIKQSDGKKAQADFDKRVKDEVAKQFKEAAEKEGLFVTEIGGAGAQVAESDGSKLSAKELARKAYATKKNK